MLSSELSFSEKNLHISLIKSVLLVVLGVSLFAAVTNLFIFKSIKLGALNVVSVFFSLLLFIYYYRSNNVRVSSWLLCFLVVFNLVVLIAMTKGSSYTLIWLAILPPISFFLLGRKAGSWLVLVTFTLVSAYVFYMRTEKITTSLTVGAFMNIVGVFIFLLLLFRYYEASREAAYTALERLSITDKLTGLYNRSKLDEILTEQLAISNRLKQPMVVVIADCDHFKKINDEHGHLYGDYVLKKLAQTLRAYIRETDFVGRWGGEEFLIVCPATTAEQAQVVIERLREGISVLQLRQNRHITMTFGVAQSNEHGDLLSLINRADRALYQGKHAGRNTVVVYNENVFPS